MISIRGSDDKIPPGDPTSHTMLGSGSEADVDNGTRNTASIKQDSAVVPGSEPVDGISSAPFTAEYVTGVKLVVIVAAVTFAGFITMLDTMIISTAIPAITDDFHSLVDVGWYASTYQLGSAAPQLLIGRFYKFFSTKWTFMVFFAVFELGSVLCGAAVSSDMFIIGRFIAGFGAAGIGTGCLLIVSSCAPLEKRPALIGMSMGVTMLGLVAGPLIGGAFTYYTTWRWCFYVNLPAGGAAALAIFFLSIPEQEQKPKFLTLLPRLHHHLDLLGFLLFASAILMLLLGLQLGSQDYPWSSSRVIGLLCGAAVGIVVWFFWNRFRGSNAMMPKSLLSKRNVLFSGVYASLLMSALYAGVYYLPIYFQAVNDANALMSAVYLLPMILAQLFTAVAGGVAISKIGFVIPVAIFSTVFLSTGTGLYAILQPGSPTGWWVGFQILAGVGSGAGLQLAIITTQAAMNSEELASGIAFVRLANAMGPAITLTLSNVIFLESLKNEISQRFSSDEVNADAIISLGATGFRSVVSAENLQGVLVAFATSINHTFYLAAALAALCSVFLWGMGWHDLRRKEGTHEEDDVVEAERSEKGDVDIAV